MLTSDIESKLAIVKSKPTYRGSPERGASLLLKIDISISYCIKRKNSGMRLRILLFLWGRQTLAIVHLDAGILGKFCDQSLQLVFPQTKLSSLSDAALVIEFLRGGSA